MNDLNKEFFSSTNSIDKETMEQFIQLFELPDEQFDMAYPFFKEKIKEIYSSEKFQNENLEKMKFLPPIDLEEERKVIQKILKDIDEDDTLSANKKEMLHLMFGASLETIESLIENGRASISVKIKKLNPDAIIPSYANPTDAGADISAIEDTTIEPNETKIVKTGIAVSMPTGYMIQIYPRSGLSAKTGLRIANSVGIVDASYNKEIGVIITNTAAAPYTIEKGTRIAQLVIMPVPMIKWEEVEELEDSGRGGFGSTGTSAIAE